ncbi:hypothetical protein [uncultured Alistipes sp.]|uniref:hypothetical protein n=1 Tax=uncultured Alistipes sp. TaxID=538949 RepID=UPI0032B2F082
MRREPVTPGPGTDDESEIYERLFAEAKEYVDACRYRVCSTELPFRFLESWIQPVEPDDRDAVRQHALKLSHKKLFRSRVPVDLFTYVYEKRSVPSGRSEGALMQRRFGQFQLLLRYVSMLYMIRSSDRMRRFDLFDIENYDELVDRIFADLHDGTLPRVNYRPFL